MRPGAAVSSAGTLHIFVPVRERGDGSDIIVQRRAVATLALRDGVNPTAVIFAGAVGGDNEDNGPGKHHLVLVGDSGGRTTAFVWDGGSALNRSASVQAPNFSTAGAVSRLVRLGSRVMVMMHDTAADTGGDAMRILTWAVPQERASGDSRPTLKLQLRLSAACLVDAMDTRHAAHRSSQHSAHSDVADQRMRHELRSVDAVADALFPNVVHTFNFAPTSGSTYLFRTAKQPTPTCSMYRG